MKLSIIITIGDISLGCKSLIGPHVNDLLGVYEMGMNAAVIDPKEVRKNFGLLMAKF